MVSGHLVLAIPKEGQKCPSFEWSNRLDRFKQKNAYSFMYTLALLSRPFENRTQKSDFGMDIFLLS
jgi:hypothetical protein